MKKLISIFVFALLGLSTQAGAAVLGDVDANGTVDVSDVTALINKILGSADYVASRCDVNADGKIDVSDATTLINIILGNYEDPNLKLVGGDISLLSKYEANGAIYYDKTGARVTDMLGFYKQIGMNAMRVRLFVDPSKASAADKAGGVCQDIAFVAALGKKIKDAGHKFILDFHYSDSWADPGKQTIPSRWATLAPEVLADTVYVYTKTSLEALVAAGATPDLVQVGNETTYGMLWPSGRCYPSGADYGSGTWNNFASYFNSGARAVREVCPNARIIAHVEMGNANNPTNFFIQARNHSLDYDIMGLSYYPAYHATSATVVSALETLLKKLEVQIPEHNIMIMETGYSYAWEMPDTKDANISKNYPYTEAGQAKYTSELVTMLNKHEKVKGLFWWWPEQNEYGLNWSTNRVTDGWWNASLVNNNTGKILQAQYELSNFK
ncbi:MAG: glycosyl hydrolase 53 family protein [Bacteroidales bacterium]|nr:glycosyl hydrolase 53 family protein [Bacteroidales bacterium]